MQYGPFSVQSVSLTRRVLSVCNIGVLWPNGWMDQDETWHGGIRLGPKHIVFNGDPAPPSPQTRAQPPPIFGPCPLWPNGWMDQDATWNEVGLGPKGGHSPTFLGQYLLWPNGWMDEAGTWHGGRPQPRRLCVR